MDIINAKKLKPSETFIPYIKPIPFHVDRSVQLNYIINASGYISLVLEVSTDTIVRLFY